MPASVDEAFRIFVERPIEWIPAGHSFLMQRHGEFAAVLRAALAGPDSGQTLVQYADVVARHAAGARGA